MALWRSSSAVSRLKCASIKSRCNGPRGSPATACGQSCIELTASAFVEAAMIDRGGYGFGERVAVLLGAKASPQTITLVQHTLRATNPTGALRNGWRNVAARRRADDAPVANPG